jgi:hypothetical protein
MSTSAKHQPWADVAVFENDNASAGKTIETFLRDKGFESRSYDDKWFRYFLFLRPPRVTHRLQVRHDQVQEADELLSTEAPAALKKAIHCPSCDSRHISYPQMTRKFILPTILLHLGIIFRAIDHECYCEHCHCIWNLPGEKARPAPRPAKHFPFS